MQANYYRWEFLAPWTTVLMDHDMRVETKRISDNTYRFQFDAIYLNVQRNAMLNDAPPYDAVQRLAEAVHLVATALALSPEAWLAVLIDQCDCGWSFDPSVHESSELVPRFEFDLRQYPGDVLASKAGLRFFTVLMSATARSAAFDLAMQQLLRLSEHATSKTSTISSVPIKINLSLWNEVHDLLVGHTELIRALKPFSIPDAQHWCFVDAIEINLTGPEICSTLVLQTTALLADAPFVRFSMVTIDPPRVSCSRQELKHFLKMLTTTNPHIHMRLGSGTAREIETASTSDNRHLGVVMELVATACGALKYVNIGHLLCTTRHELDGERQDVWHYLFGTLLNPQSACEIETLALHSPRVLQTARDGLAIENARALFPNYKRPRRLTLGLTNAYQASVRAIIAAFGTGLEALALSNRGRAIPSNTVAFVLEVCPHLQCLDLRNANVNSMDLFFGPHARCRLSRLALRKVVLRDGGSFPGFLTQLADPSSAVGRSIRELVLDDANGQLKLQPSHMPLIHAVLRANGLVHTLQLDVDESVAQESIDACAAYHCTPSAVRQSPLSLPRKLAFLSTVRARSMTLRDRLHADVVRNVFAFAADGYAYPTDARRSLPPAPPRVSSSTHPACHQGLIRDLADCPTDTRTAFNSSTMRHHSRSMTLLATVTALIVALALPPTAAKFRDSDNLFKDSFHVHTLTDASFEDIRLNKTDEVWIVDFYAPWCPHCRVFAPELEKIAAFYADSKTIHVGAVDCTQHSVACNDEDILGYPTLKIYHIPKDATKGKKYNRFGMKNMQSVVKWVEDLLDEAQMPAGVSANNVDQQIELIKNDRMTDDIGLGDERSLKMKYARLQDAGSAAIFTLENSLFIGKNVLEGERYSAALLWVQALGASFPLEANRKVFRDLAAAVEERQSWDQTAWKSLIDKWKAIASQTTFPKSLLVYDEETTWAHCNTYTCGLWTLFHSMSVTAGTPACPLKPSHIAAAIRFFVEHFFGCEECVKHFLAANPPKVITKLADADADGNLKLVMWLWRMHNQVNKVTKKAFWPSVHSCPICFADNVQTPSLDPATLHEQGIVNYVTAIYEQSEDDVWSMNYENNGLGAALLDSMRGFSVVMVMVVVAIFLLAGASRKGSLSFLKREHAA